MTIVNPIYINEVLNPLIGGADSEDEIDKYSFYDSNSEQDVKHLAEHVLLPEFKKQGIEMREEVKNSLTYYLFYKNIDLESIFNSLLLPIETPTDSRVFFLWIWQVLFPNTNYECLNTETVEESFNVNAPLELIQSLRKLK